MKRYIKSWLFRVAPELTSSLLSARARKHSHRILRQWGVPAVNAELLRRFGRTVQSGPFVGLELTPSTEKEQLGPYLLGTYESELHPWIERMLIGSFSSIVDVGAKFGYYAVGFARTLSKIPIIAFDTDPWARRVLREMSIGNQASNIEIRGFCSTEWIKKKLQNCSLIISDCEGYESTLFSSVTPALVTATLLIETHDDVSPGVTQTIVDRFSATHNVEVASLKACDACPVDLSFLSELQRRHAIREVRSNQRWLLLTPQ